MSDSSWILRHLQFGRIHYYIFVPAWLGDPRVDGQTFETEVVRVIGDQARIIFDRQRSSPRPPRGLQQGDEEVVYVQDNEQLRFPLPQSTTPPIERFTLLVTRVLCAPWPQLREWTSHELRVLHGATIGQPIIPRASPFQHHQAAASIEVGYRLPERHRIGPATTTAASQRATSPSSTAPDSPISPAQDTSQQPPAASPSSSSPSHPQRSPSTSPPALPAKPKAPPALKITPAATASTGACTPNESAAQPQGRWRRLKTVRWHDTVKGRDEGSAGKK